MKIKSALIKLSKILCMATFTMSIFVGCNRKDDKEKKMAAVIASVGIGSWRPASIGVNCPQPRMQHTAVWTGNKMIVWGGYTGGSMNTGGIYDPETDTWSPTSTGVNCPSPRHSHTAVWTGLKMIIWGGYNYGVGYENTGGIYDPGTDTWTATSTGSDCPSARYFHTAIWTGAKMIIWGGENSSVDLNSGGVYDPGTDTWTTTSIGVGCPSARRWHSTIWNGSEMIIWGGTNSMIGDFDTGGIYDPEIDTWIPILAGPESPSARLWHTAVWTGSQMIIWGGDSPYPSPYQIMLAYTFDPDANTWKSTSPGRQVEGGVRKHTSIWTGSKMIEWGGKNIHSHHSSTGSIYDPQTNIWVPTYIGDGCPSGRWWHSAVWTGSEMIIWGGAGENGFINTGGIYTPPDP